MTPSAEPLLLRADAGERVGAGHVMRCLALAQAWRAAGGDAVFVTRPLPAALAERLRAEGARVCPLPTGDDAQQTIALAAELGAKWIVLDGYEFGHEYQRAIKGAGLRLLVLDDYGHASDHCANLVLNQNIQATREMYSRREPSTELLLGTRYVLLRQEFLQARKARAQSGTVRRVLVSMGGADPDNVTLKMLEALTALEVETTAVIGPANPRGAALEEFARQSGGRLRVRRNATDMPELMAAADLAVAAAGSTCWELAYMGLPQLLVILAENQRGAAERLDAIGAARNLGWHASLDVATLRAEIATLLADRERCAAMSERASELVDGRGAQRVVMAMKSRSLTLRPAGPDDARLIFDWANEPATRAASFSSERIPWEQHRDWFTRKLRDPDCHFFVVLGLQQKPIGQVRFDRIGADAVISLSLDAGARGRGIGSAVISAACRELFQKSDTPAVTAYIKPDNEASLRAFLNADFEPLAPTTTRGQTAAHLVFRRPEL